MGRLGFYENREPTMRMTYIVSMMQNAMSWFLNILGTFGRQGSGCEAGNC